MKANFKIEGLDCANCASKIERSIQKLEGVKMASVNFFTGKLIVEYDESFSELINKVEQIVKNEEPDVKLRRI